MIPLTIHNVKECKVYSKGIPLISQNAYFYDIIISYYN